MARTRARVDGTTLVAPTTDDSPITVGTPAWFAWLETATAFAFASSAGSFNAHKERKTRGGGYWRASRTAHGTLHRAYLGKSEDLTLDRLEQVAETLGRASDPHPQQSVSPPPMVTPLTLLATKLFVPPARADLVPRSRLFDRMKHGLERKLTVIAAPAGFGKTTLLSTWHAAAGKSAPPLAWVSLDAGDNDPMRFWAYVFAALDGVAPGIAVPALALLQSPQPPPIDRMLTTVLNAFAQQAPALAAGPSTADTALVLEDYHVITNPAIHDALSQFLDYLPPRLHLVIVTRVDPPLPLARLRANGAVTELRATDLRFAADETAAFLNQHMGLALADDDVAALETRTEGWVAGLQLVALALRDHGDRAGFIRTFTGSNRYVVDYLVAEVFARQSTALQTFLLYTSILDRMCGPLCDAILALPGQDDLAVSITSPPSQDMLLELERTNLFVVPLDDERSWYRYHHLFGEVLRQRLQRGVAPAMAAVLHERASAWYEHEGFIAESVQHALAAADWARVARLIEEQGLRLIVGGQIHMVLGWFNRLPATLFRAHPLLAIFHALALLFTNELAAAEVRLQDAERSIGPDSPPGEADAMQGYAAAIRANIALYTGDLADCVAAGEQVLRLLPETEVIARTTAQLHVARSFRVSGDVTKAAEQRALAAIAPIRATGSLLGTVGAISNVARLQVLQGRLRTAMTTYHELVPIGSGLEELRQLHGGVAYFVAMGELYCEWNDLDAAEVFLAQAIERLSGTQTVDAEDVVQGYLAMARLQHVRGDHATAERTLLTVRDVARERGFVAHLLARVSAAQALLALVSGDLSAAITWATASGLHAQDVVAFPREAEYMILARVCIAQGLRTASGSTQAQALLLLERLLEDATVKGRHDSAITILIVQALGRWAQGMRSEALQSIERALVLAEPEDYVRRFVDEGPAMEALLRAAYTSGIAQRYVSRLLAAFPGSITRSRASSLPIYGGGGERLSVRELEVLRLIADGSSNVEIARRLVIAPSTVKSHINSIFGKLEATSRSEAIQRARALHLIDR